MKKKDLITVRDYSYNLEDGELGYYQSQFVSAKDYVNSIANELKEKKETFSSFITVEQISRELQQSQYIEEELAAKEKVENYLSKSNNKENQRKFAI